MTRRDDTCEACGRSSLAIARFAAAFRKREIRVGRPDPGFVCAGCAEIWTHIVRWVSLPIMAEHPLDVIRDHRARH
jgi:hypothetical protein